MFRACLSAFFLCCLLPTTALAQNETVEFPIWSRTYAGTLGKKTVEVQLERIADTISGSYCYAPCKDETRYTLHLQGTVTGQVAQLSETIGVAAKSGAWTLILTDGSAKGAWKSPDAKRVLPMVLSETGTPPPYDIRLVADTLPDADNSCPTPPMVHQIRLYRKGKLVQALPTESQGTCSIFTPQFVDMNFDGHLDLMIAQTLPAGPNIPYDMWLFDPATQTFVTAPASLLDVTSPEFDAEHHKVWNFWRGSCCDHGIDVFTWKNGNLEPDGSGESYVMPVRVGTTDYYCYVTPAYVDGRVGYPDAAIKDASGKVLVRGDLKGCDVGPYMLERTRVDVWQKKADGTLVLTDTQGVTWQKTQVNGATRYCPVVPFVNNGQIVPAALNSDPDLCSEDDPNPA
ncbi:hypothetical protein MMA231_02976 [Asticcacaulis sp. MM231]|uniref:XAC2610-related protein n=1 Tax=Asticcacaulis sp. MM231 TaxID=3157666 RepID=UPI0032D58B9D